MRLADESGAALMQVVFVSALLALLAYFFMTAQSNSDRNNLRFIHRNDNLSIADSLADLANDGQYLSQSGAALQKDAAGIDVLYQ